MRAMARLSQAKRRQRAIPETVRTRRGTVGVGGSSVDGPEYELAGDPACSGRDGAASEEAPLPQQLAVLSRIDGGSGLTVAVSQTGKLKGRPVPRMRHPLPVANRGAVPARKSRSVG